MGRQRRPADRGLSHVHEPARQGGADQWRRDPDRCDLTDDAALGDALGQVRQRWGRIDLVINLACTYLDQGIASDRSEWLRALDINLVSAVQLVRAVHADLKVNGGVVINFTSISAGCAQTGRWLYPVSKAALHQLTRCMAMDLAADGIRVNSVSPGWTWSRVIAEVSGGDRAKADRVAADYHLLGRLGRSGPGGGLPLFAGGQLRHWRGLRGGWRLLGDGT